MSLGAEFESDAALSRGPRPDAKADVRAETRGTLRNAADAVLEAEGEERLRRGFAFEAELVAAAEAALIELDPTGDARILGFYPEGARPGWIEQGVSLAQRAKTAGTIVFEPARDIGSQDLVPRVTDALDRGAREDPGPDPTWLMAQSLRADGQERLVAVALAAPTPFALALARERLELASSLIEASASAGDPSRDLVDAVSLLAALGSAARFEDMASVLCTELANRFDASRVHLALLDPLPSRTADGTATGGGLGHRTRLVARDHASELDANGAEAVSIRERADQAVMRDLDTSRDESRELALPLRVGGRPRGALVVARREAGFARREVEVLRLVLDLAAPRLCERAAADRPLSARLAARLRAIPEQLARPEHTARKLASLSVVLFTALALFGYGTLRIEAPFTIEPSEGRVVSAPFDGRLAETSIEPGDAVVAGESVLAVLDTEELELELSRARSEVLQALKEADVARTAGSPASEQVARFAAQRARASVALLESRLDDARLLAPVDGIVLEGDLRKRLGGPVARGEQLVRVAPLAALRAELEVSEHDISFVSPGQRGTIAAASDPGAQIAFEITRIDPIARAGVETNTFRVIAELRPETGRAVPLPGVTGVAKIDAGRGRFLWLWTRHFWDALRLRLWI